MNRQPVSSSNVRSVGYDSASSTLEVSFHDGGVYQYFGVPSTVYAGLMAAASKGGYLHRYIKGRYRYSKVF